MNVFDRLGLYGVDKKSLFSNTILKSKYL